MTETGRTRPPDNLPSAAVLCLQALAQQGLGDKISIGGALGLLHYLDYRPTHDADGWWSASATTEDRQRVVEVLQAALRTLGDVKTRSWGDVVSIDLIREGRTTFTFQIANRSAQLEPSQRVAWTDVLLDSFADLVASKMVALVERGAPRDLRDIYALCQAGLTTPRHCWDLWQRRQQAADSDADRTRARLAVETHLARIAQYRPLEAISDPQQRSEADRVRGWFKGEFLSVLE
jgi:hypothetical protein